MLEEVYSRKWHMGEGGEFREYKRSSVILKNTFLQKIVIS